jgi:uncharacterized protein YdhG (YjbR/CyaY superfamily)
MGTRPRTIDEYLAGTTAANRAALQKVRAAVRAAAPKAEECIAYGMPAFRLDGTYVAGFRAAARHCAFHPMSGTTVDALRDELAGYDKSRGTVRFPPERPLPAALVRKLVRARIAENTGAGAKPRPRQAKRR